MNQKLRRTLEYGFATLFIVVIGAYSYIRIISNDWNTIIVFLGIHILVVIIFYTFAHFFDADD